MNSAAITVLAAAGIEEAESALRRIQSQLVSPTQAGREKLHQLGFRLEELDPNLHRIAEIVRKLSTAGLAADDARIVFGQRGAPAVLALIAGVERLETLQGSM